MHPGSLRCSSLHMFNMRPPQRLALQAPRPSHVARIYDTGHYDLGTLTARTVWLRFPAHEWPIAQMSELLAAVTSRRSVQAAQASFAFAAMPM